MGSVTIRKLDEAVKARLRIRAARHGRSLEEEVRQLLVQMAGEAEQIPNERTPSASTGKERSDKAEGQTARAPRERQAEGNGALAGKRILLIIGGGIAAYKCLDLIRRLRERGAQVRPVMTRAAQEFITPISVGAVAGERVFTDLFDPTTEFDVGHIRLSREADLVVVAPATADLLAKMANGHADDLASTALLATDKPVLIAPAMNPRMWSHPATRRNVARLQADGIAIVGPNIGEMAERGEYGPGRMAEPMDILAAIVGMAGRSSPSPSSEYPLAGRTIIVTSGPTHEPIDPVRYIANRSSGKQGHAIARAAAEAGADTVLITGPVDLPDPPGVRVIKVESARDMLEAVERSLPADIAIFAAAVADWRVAEAASHKMKKDSAGTPTLALVENPDILSTVAHKAKDRPRLVIGFAAETDNVIAHARSKLAKKGCDWILANDVSPGTGIMGGDINTIHLVTASGVEEWPTQTKDEVAHALIARIAATLGETTA